jgi:hypothetical protein
MAQTTNYEIANSSGLIFRGRVNEVLAAVQSNNSGATTPTGTVAYQLWYDTTTNILKMRNASNSAWIDLFTLDQTNSVWSVNANSTSNALRITQTGTGNALLVEDSTNPDSTPFVVTADGNVGIGTDAPNEKLDVRGGVFIGDAATSINYNGMILDYNTSTREARLAVGATSGGDSFFTLTTASGGTEDERMRITSAGDLLVGKTSSNTSSVGFEIQPSGLVASTRDANVSAIFGRNTDDGQIVQFRQAGANEGSISVSGTTVSYNGGHLSRWAQFPDNSRPELLKGTVMSNLDQMSNWDGEDNEQLNCVQVSAVEGDANVAGVFVAWDSEDDGYNDILLAMTGDMVIRIAADTIVQRGDLLMSAGDGTAKPQGDDIMRSKTLAKVTSTHVSHTYADGSYAVPCVLMAC